MFPKGTIRHHPFDPIVNFGRGKAYERIGMRTTMLVPRPAEVRTSSCAPRFLALACILDNPKPSLHAARGLAMPDPLSATSRTSFDGSQHRLTLMTVGMAWRTALLSASCAIRRRSSWTEDGKLSSGTPVE